MPVPTIGIDNPFVGLRSFEPSESLLFHGRKQHTQQLLRLLASHRALGVIGTSGSGKSSLVKAGLLPALYRGYLRGATSRWKMAVMRPGSAPLARLAESLCDPRGLALPSPPEDVARRLEENSAALAATVREKLHADDENLLLVVDQFEELLRRRPEAHDESARQAALFVNLLLRARDEPKVPIFIVLTMRSEFLGDSAQYPGLAEALSEAQYLIPRLTRDQREEAIRGPLDIVGADIDDALIQRLLNDAGDDPDQLPALQHSLMRLYQQTPRGERMSLEGYKERLRVGRSLNFHAEEILDSLTPTQRKLAERVFRCLTTTEDGVEVRRPTILGDIYAIVDAQTPEARADVRAAVKAFSRKENSLLFSSTGTDLKDDTRVDITHESLIRQWDLLQEWVRREAEAADWFGRLARSAQLYTQGRGGLWGSLDAEFAMKGMVEDAWTQPWGDQYRPGFGQAKAFLEKSLSAIKAIEEEKQRAAREIEESRARELQAAQDLVQTREREAQTARELAATRERELGAARRGRKRLLFALGGLAAVTAGLVYFAWLWREERALTDEIRRIGSSFALQRIQDLQNEVAKLSGSKAGSVQANKVDDQRYVYIPAGKFMMGCSPGDSDCADEENPAHEVEISRGFWIGQTEVTQIAYQKVMKTNPSRFKGADHPVESVDWFDAKHFCEAVGMQLPTEAQWEYAARAGSREARYGMLDRVAWFRGNSNGQTQPVAAKAPNAWGLYDILGNVWEWVGDWYDAKYYDQKVAVDPTGSISGSRRVLRGGSWDGFSQNHRVSFRGWGDPAVRVENFGFRCAGELR